MKKFITVVLLVVALLAVSNVSYGDSTHIGTTNITTNNQGGEGGKGGNATASIGDVKNVNDITNKNKNINDIDNKNVNNIDNKNKNINDNSNKNSNVQGQLQGQIQGQGQDQGQSQVNEGNQNQIDIQDNSSYTEINPTELLNPQSYVPLAEKLAADELYLSKSIFCLRRSGYNYKELTRFANPGRFIGFLWPEWDNTYHIEVATFAKYSATKGIQVVASSAIAAHLGLIKIGEGQAFAKDLNKSEHQVMAALAFRATQAGATVIVYKTFSNPLVKVDSFVVGGGGTQVGSPTSIFNGASGIGTSSNETLTRASVVAEFYR